MDDAPRMPTKRPTETRCTACFNPIHGARECYTCKDCQHVVCKDCTHMHVDLKTGEVTRDQCSECNPVHEKSRNQTASDAKDEIDNWRFLTKGLPVIVTAIIMFVIFRMKMG